MKRFGNGYPVCQRFFFFFFGETRESEIAKKLFLAFSSSPKKKLLTPREGNGQFTVYFSV